jgi:cytosine/adenosine deaminase-related metal-dependent hydrolase
MLDRLYYTLNEAQEILQTSRAGLKQLERAGLIVMHGANHGKRVTGASLRALEQRIAEGEDIWAVVKASENPALSEPKRTARGRSTKIVKDDGGTNPAKR